MKEIYFIVEGRVQPKERPKVFRDPRTGRVHAVTPKRTKVYEELVREAFLEECAGEKIFFEGAVQMTVNVYLEIPKSTPKKKRDAMILGDIRPTVKNGDVDNYFKAVSDALNGVAYPDDSCIVDSRCRKFYSIWSRAEVIIKEVKG